MIHGILALRRMVGEMVINNSSGYEGWDLMGPKGFEVIATGGGGLAS
jgi:hypothetical protein